MTMACPLARWRQYVGSVDLRSFRVMKNTSCSNYRGLWRSDRSLPTIER